MRDLCDEYARLFGVKVIHLDDVVEWAIENGKWRDRQLSKKQRAKREIANALRRTHHTDPQNREVRTWHAALVEDEKGQMSWQWGDMREADPDHMRLSQQFGRRQILDHCRQHSIVGESYNDNNPYGAYLEPTDYNFNLDLEEEKYSTDYPDEPDED